MIHPSIRYLLVLVVLLAWTGIPATAECDDTFGNDCQAQDLDTNDPPGGDECGGPITVTSAASSGTTLVVGLSNPSESTAQGFVVATVILMGQEYVYAVPVSVSAESTQNLLLIFPKSFTTVGVYTCSQKPGGINEGPDVVGVREEEEAP